MFASRLRTSSYLYLLSYASLPNYFEGRSRDTWERIPLYSRRQSRQGARQLFSFNLVGVVVAMGVRDWPTMSVTSLMAGKSDTRKLRPCLFPLARPSFTDRHPSSVSSLELTHLTFVALERAGRRTSKGRNPRRRLSIEGCAIERGGLSSSVPSLGIVIDWKPVIQLVPR